MCGKVGHKAAQCLYDDKNAGRRSQGWKKKSETGLSTAGGDRTSGSEFLLMTVHGIQFKATTKLLEDQNILIGDTGASSNTTGSRLGFRHVQGASARDNIVDASGNDMNSEIIGDVSGTFCNKCGQELMDATIKDMVYSPNSKFNLFSITKRLEDGYELGGDKEAIWISKGEKRLCLT